MSIDLHLHSVASDGLHTPRELVAMAAQLGLSAIAVTDHDSVNAVPEALQAGRESGVAVLPALELSSHIGERDVHFLGYYVDYTSPDLAAHLRTLREARLSRAVEMLALLREHRVDLSMEDLLTAAGDGAMGRAHVAGLLVTRGHTPTVADAFERYLARGACCYVEKAVMAPSAVIALIRRIGGVPVLAHPGVSRADDHIEALVGHGLRGIEAFHADHTEEEIARYQTLARRLGLVVTGGSDFHGKGVRGQGVGAIEVPDWVLDDLEAARGAAS